MVKRNLKPQKKEQKVEVNDSIKSTANELVTVPYLPPKPSPIKKEIKEANKGLDAPERLSRILKDPSCIILSVSKICKLADISRPTYYNLFKDTDFVRKVEQEAQELLLRNDLPVLHNITEKAKNPETKSHHWAQMFMKMRGRLSDQPVKPAQIKVVFNVNRPPEIKTINNEPLTIEVSRSTDEED